MSKCLLIYLEIFTLYPVMLYRCLLSVLSDTLTVRLTANEIWIEQWNASFVDNDSACNTFQSWTYENSNHRSYNCFIHLCSLLMSKYHDNNIFITIYITWVFTIILVYVAWITGIWGWHKNMRNGGGICRPISTGSMISRGHPFPFFLVLFYILQVNFRLIVRDNWYLMAP